MEPRPVQVRSHDSAIGRWEMASAETHPALRRYVSRYEGWAETGTSFSTRIETPSPISVLIINFGDPLQIRYPRFETEFRAFEAGFFAGLIDTHCLVENGRSSAGLQVDLTPLGAYRLVGRPMHELTNRSVALADVFGIEGRVLAERLREAPDWQTRFAIMDLTVARALAANPGVEAGVSWAWRRLRSSGGLCSVGELALGLGWSPRRLIASFREQLGLPPKTVGRVIRFGRATDLIRAEAAPVWSEIALRCGYFDQAHLVRDFRDFTGGTPTEFLARKLPDGGGFSGD